MKLFSALLTLCGRNPLTKVSDAWLWCFFFFLIYVWTNGWANNRSAGDLKHYCCHYDVTLMMCHVVEYKQNVRHIKHITIPPPPPTRTRGHTHIPTHTHPHTQAHTKCTLTRFALCRVLLFWFSDYIIYDYLTGTGSIIRSSTKNEILENMDECMNVCDLYKTLSYTFLYQFWVPDTIRYILFVKYD